MSAVAAQKEGMRAQVLRGVVWKATSQVVFQVSRIVVAVLLARLLAPHDYGLAMMVLVFASFALVFSDLALGAALVQRPHVSELDRSTVFWTSLAAGAGFTLLGVGLSGPIAAFYGEPAVQPLLAALSFTFVITSLGTTQSALLMRDMDFRNLEIRLMVGMLAGAVVGITVAARGAGAWAIILQQLTLAVVSTALVWRFSSWKPRFAYSLKSLRELGGFGANVFGQRVLYYTTRSIDNVLIGRFLGPAAVGAYALAYNVMLVPATRIGVPIQEVLFPAFSRMQDDPERIASVWLRVCRLVAAISIPPLVTVIVVAEEFVLTVLGAEWSAAVPVIQILAWVGILQSIQTLNGDILQAVGRAGTQFLFTLLWFGANLTAFVIGLQWGIVGVAAGFAVSSTVLAPLSLWLTARAVHVSLLDFGRSLSGVAQAAIVMLASLLLARPLLEAAGIPAGARLIVLGLLAAAVFLPFCAWRAGEVRADLRALLRRGAAAQASGTAS
jgi:O-antigen/teichoic acid export membrane protein